MSKNSQSKDKDAPLKVTVMSFGYKQGAPPYANLVFDVRFLKNPFWVDHLRPLSGRDKEVQEYVLAQSLASDFLDSTLDLLKRLLPQLIELKLSDFSIAFGCTGGQHRSVTLGEILAFRLRQLYPELTINCLHRELDGAALLTSHLTQSRPASAMAED